MHKLPRELQGPVQRDPQPNAQSFRLTGLVCPLILGLSKGDIAKASAKIIARPKIYLFGVRTAQKPKRVRAGATGI